MGLTSFRMSQVCGQAKGTESWAGSKNAGTHSQIQKAKRSSLPRKPLAVKKTVLLQAPAREVRVSFGVQRAELPWEKTFSVIPTPSMFFFQHLFTVNYCFRLYPVLLSFFPRQLLRGT